MQAYEPGKGNSQIEGKEKGHKKITAKIAMSKRLGAKNLTASHLNVYA